jgi:O-methyltransferase
MQQLVAFFGQQIRSHLSFLTRQRLKLAFYFFPYLRLLGWTWLPDRFGLFFAFLRIDWSVECAHRPSEIVAITRAFRDLPAGCMIEAGCWRGGSSTKFSLLCARFGRSLVVYDSFEGVQVHEVAPDQYNFAGEYAAPLEVALTNVTRYGDIGVTKFVKGWFSDTLAVDPPADIAIAYIDCDVAEGTCDALKGICATRVPNGVVFSQDYHIIPVRELLDSPKTWQEIGCPPPQITPQVHHTALLHWR